MFPMPYDLISQMGSHFSNQSVEEVPLSLSGFGGLSALVGSLQSVGRSELLQPRILTLVIPGN